MKIFYIISFHVAKMLFFLILLSLALLTNSADIKLLYSNADGHMVFGDRFHIMTSSNEYFHAERDSNGAFRSYITDDKQDATIFTACSFEGNNCVSNLGEDVIHTVILGINDGYYLYGQPQDICKADWVSTSPTSCSQVSDSGCNDPGKENARKNGIFYFNNQDSSNKKEYKGYVDINHNIRGIDKCLLGNGSRVLAIGGSEAPKLLFKFERVAAYPNRGIICGGNGHFLHTEEADDIVKNVSSKNVLKFGGNSNYTVRFSRYKNGVSVEKDAVKFIERCYYWKNHVQYSPISVQHRQDTGKSCQGGAHWRCNAPLQCGSPFGYDVDICVTDHDVSLGKVFPGSIRIVGKDETTLISI